jgi:hypothetical protein
MCGAARRFANQQKVLWVALEIVVGKNMGSPKVAEKYSSGACKMSKRWRADGGGCCNANSRMR